MKVHDFVNEQYMTMFERRRMLSRMHKKALSTLRRCGRALRTSAIVDCAKLELLSASAGGEKAKTTPKERRGLLNLFSVHWPKSVR